MKKHENEYKGNGLNWSKFRYKKLWVFKPSIYWCKPFPQISLYILLIHILLSAVLDKHHYHDHEILSKTNGHNGCKHKES